jgi:PPOX class probable F420-dependent enzyme
MARDMTDEERRQFLLAGTRTGKVAWISPRGNVHVAPIWFVLDGDEVVFTTHNESAKGRALTEGAQVSLVVDDQAPPYSYVKVDGTVTISEDLDELVSVANRIGGRYMGPERAE